MDISLFTDKSTVPTDDDLVDALGHTCDLWHMLMDYVHLKYPNALDQWNYPGKKYGWNFRIKDEKRTIIYLLPRDGFFKVAFVFGQKATDTIKASGISEVIKMELESARVYGEGRGIRIDVNDESLVDDIKELIDIKLAN